MRQEDRFSIPSHSLADVGRYPAMLRRFSFCDEFVAQTQKAGPQWDLSQLLEMND